MKKLTYLFLALLIVACSDDGSGDGSSNDTTAPIITLNGQAIATVNLNSTYTDAGATALDDIDGNLTSSIVTTGEVNTSIEGDYIITYTVSDSAGNTATTTRQVIVEDDDNPVYLAENGVTIKAKEWALVGEIGVVNGIGYTIVDTQTLENMISNDEDVTRVCTSRIIDMSNMFNGDTYFNQPIGNWDVSNVTTMQSMFSCGYGFVIFNQDISYWDVSSVTDMKYMFMCADLQQEGYSHPFNQPIGDWDVSNVTEMQYMFGNATSFNQPIGNWNVSNVTNMGLMFFQAEAFNQPIGDWDVSNVTAISGMFSQAEAFNQPLDNWDVSSVTDMREMFRSTESFNQDISSWSVDNVTDCLDFSTDAPLTEANTPNFTNCTP